ncbi:MAG: TlpA family protein disulfide reductase [Chitinophagaceae bacterium]|nr:MAG: TlpA family protein disulfide reductase [Chitinophagaceae bacterium]
MFKLLIKSFLLSLLITPVYAQQYDHPLKIGEQVPDIQLRVLNSSQPAMHISQFRGKILILDFWSTWCSACIGEFPKLEVLQNKFKDKLMILPIGFELEPGDIRKFIIKNKTFTLPTAIQTKQDSVIMKLFPFNGVPHEVWIDKNGKLIGFSDQFALTSDNIKQLLNGKKIFLPGKQMDVNFDLSQPLLANNNGGRSTDFLSRSIITRYNPLLRQVQYNRTDSINTKITMINKTALILIKIAFGNSYADSSLGVTLGFDPMDKRIILEGDRIRSQFKHWPTFENLTEREWYDFEKNNLYCYETILPKSYSLREAYRKMLFDLQYFFKVKVLLEKRKLNCLALVRTNSKQTKDETPKSVVTDILPKEIIRKGNTDQIVSYINNNFKTMPLVINGINSDNTISSGSVIYKASYFQKIQTELSTHGLKLIPVRKTIDMLVIKNAE